MKVDPKIVMDPKSVGQEAVKFIKEHKLTF